MPATKASQPARTATDAPPGEPAAPSAIPIAETMAPAIISLSALRTRAIVANIAGEGTAASVPRRGTRTAPCRRGAFGSNVRRMRRFAAIDAGSNALRLRIIETDGPSVRVPERLANGVFEREHPSGWREIAYVRAAVRLGSEVFLTGELAESAIDEAVAAFVEFRQTMDRVRVDAWRATATSAVREATNGQELVERIRREAHLDLEIIDGAEEARLIQIAVTRRMNLVDRRALLVDVGGGSTELTLLDGGVQQYGVSLPLGTVRLLDLFLGGTGIVDDARARRLDDFVLRALQGGVDASAFDAGIDVLIGTGGNVETLLGLCAMPGGFLGYSRAVDTGALADLVARLGCMSPDERRERFGLRVDRADTIVPASTIFLRIAQRLGHRALVAPFVGLKEGIIEDVIDGYFAARGTAPKSAGDAPKPLRTDPT